MVTVIQRSVCLLVIAAFANSKHTLSCQGFVRARRQAQAETIGLKRQNCHPSVLNAGSRSGRLRLPALNTGLCPFNEG